MYISGTNHMKRERLLSYFISVSIFALLVNMANWNMRKEKLILATNLARGPTKGFVIAMDNETGWRVAEKLKQAFEIEEMQVIVGSAGKNSQLPLYNRYLMHHGRTDTLQIGNLNMLGCMQSHREVWSRIQQDSYIFEHDAKPAKNALQTVKKPQFKKIWTTVQAVDWIEQPTTVQISYEFISLLLTVRNFINPHND